MKRLICWWSGHNYVIGVVRTAEAVVRNTGPRFDAVICLRCGAHSIYRLETGQGE